MSDFNTPVDLFAIYDMAGSKTAQTIGSGSQLCYCFALDTTKNVHINNYFLIGAGGEVRIRNSGLGGDVC